jgi:TctA family transporter
MIHGITPGPRVIMDHPELFWGLVASMWIGNVILLILNIPLIGLWVRVLSIPYSVLCPAILLLICIGVFSTSNNPVDIVILAAFGVIGYVFFKLDCPAAPLLLGVILGPLIEENLRRALLISLGDPSVFVTRPISLVLLLCAFLLIVGFIVTNVRKKPAK